jgi:hypothetical protein
VRKPTKDLKPEVPGTSPYSFSIPLEPSDGTPTNALASFSYATSHGFGSASLEEAKRAIPWYAAIHGKVNGGNDKAMVASNRLLKLIIGLLVVKTNLVLVAEKS